MTNADISGVPFLLPEAVFLTPANTDVVLGTVTGPASSATTAVIFVALQYVPDATATSCNFQDFAGGHGIQYTENLPVAYLSGVVSGVENPDNIPISFALVDTAYTSGKTYTIYAGETGAADGGSITEMSAVVLIPAGAEISVGDAPVGALSVFCLDPQPTPGCQYKFTITETGATDGGEVTDIIAETD